MVPKPSATATHGMPVAVDTVRLRQRQMAYGDSTMRRATVVLTRADGREVRVPFRFGEPSLDGSTGTRLTTFELDGYGRVGLPAFVEVAVDPPVPDVVASTVIAEATYPYKLPPGPIQVGGRVDPDGNPAFRVDHQETLAFYAPDGTFDVGLVDIELRFGGALVPAGAFANASFSDPRAGMNVYMEEHEHPGNAWLNPYRSAEAALYRKNSTNPFTGETVWSWPCPVSSNSTGCSMEPVRRYWSFPGWGLKHPSAVSRPHELLPLATPDNFALLQPKPALTLRFAAPVRVARVGLRQRQMAWGDATMARMAVYADGVLAGTADFGAPSADGATLLTDLSRDPYGRAGLASEVNVSLPAGTVRELIFVATEVHAYAPPAALGDPHGAWDVSPLATQYPTFYDYVAPTQGTWNVGLTHAALYASDTRLVAEADVLGAEATASGAFAGPLFAPGNPFYNPYRTTDEQTFANDMGERVYRSWCFDGWAVLHGATPTAYAFVEPTPPPPLLPGGIAPAPPDDGPVPEPV
jgi:hypothetical protein